MEVQNLPTDSIRPYESNPRVNDDAVDFVARSIQQYGFRQPIVVDSDMVIVKRWEEFTGKKAVLANAVTPQLAANKKGGE